MKVLIVDDEVKFARHLKIWLKQEGYIVDVLFDGEEGLNFILINHESIDLILLDQMLPLKQGSDICKIVRRHQINTPILMLTAKDLDSDIVYGLKAGADDYLTKPFSLLVLAARMQALLRRPSIHNQIVKEIKIGNLELNATTHKVTYKQKELPLTLKEYSILEYLMKHPNIVIDREELLEKLWDANFTSFSNVVDVQITRLRKKLKKVSDDHILETIRGVGFKLRVE